MKPLKTKIALKSMNKQKSDIKDTVISYPNHSSYEINDNDSVEITLAKESGIEIEEEITQPFDPNKISIEKSTITVDSIIRRFEQNTLNLTPNFQRKEVWDVERKSRLIESLLLKIPIPMFYMSSDEFGVLTVVDGLQRLSSIRDFLLSSTTKQRGKGFKLQGLEFWGEKYEGKTFNELDIYLQNRLLETQFSFTVINMGTPEEVKRNIFKRINTGGMPLSAQEIRNALYSGYGTELIKKLAESKEFKDATDNSVKDLRMADRELVLRFIAFLVRDYTHYPTNGDMDAFLSDTLIILNHYGKPLNPKLIKKAEIESLLNKANTVNIDKIEKLFSLAMKRAKKLFGANAYRKSLSSERRSPVNKSLFEVWNVILAGLSETEFNNLLKNKTQLKKDYSELLKDAVLFDFISKNSWKPSSVIKRYEQISDVVRKNL